MTVHVDFTGSDKGLGAEQAKLAKGAGELDRNYREAAAAAGQLERMSKKAFMDSLPPAERFNREVAGLKDLLAKNRLEVHEFEAGVAKLKAKYDEAGQSSSAAFGSAALSQLTAMGAGLLSISTIQQAIVGHLREEAALRERAAEFVRSGERGTESLAQLATPTLRPGEKLSDLSDAEVQKRTDESFRELVGAAKEFVRIGAAQDMTSASAQIFSLKSAGLFDQREFFGQVGRSGLFSDMGGLTTAINTLVTSLGEKETGSAKDIVSKALGAARYSPARAEALLSAASRGATGAKELGLSDEELLAGTSILSAAKGTPEIAGTYIAALLRSMSKGLETKDGLKTFKGKSLKDAVAEIDAMGMDFKQLSTALGDATAVEAFSIIRDRSSLIDTALGDIANAQERGSVKFQIGAAMEGDSQTTSARLRREAENRRKLEEVDSEGEEELIRERLFEIRKRMSGEGVGRFLAGLAEFRDTYIAPSIALEAARTSPALAAAAEKGDTEVADLLRRIEGHLARQAGNQQRQPTAKSETGK